MKQKMEGLSREKDFELYVVVKLKGFGLPEHKQGMVNTLRRQCELTFGDRVEWAHEAEHVGGTS